MASLYDRADIFDLFSSEKQYNVVKKHWEKLLAGTNIHTLLDVSIGTGNLTLPVAELGVQLYGSDLSEGMLEKCREKADRKGMSVNLRVSDFRRLKENFEEKFDCVASTGNSIPYVSNAEILGVLEQMDSLVKEDGYLYYDIRNWDKILSERNRFYLYNPIFHEDVRINVMQAWDYHADGSMTFNILYTFEKENRIFQKEIFEEYYFPVKREILIDKLKSLGYGEIRVMGHPACFDRNPEEADWYCVMAKRCS